MDAFVLGLRIAVAVVLVVAAVAKLRGRRPFRDAMEELGVPSRLAQFAQPTVPAVELVAATLLVPASTAPIGGALAGAMFMAFTALLAGNLLRGRRPACNCFGRLSAKPIAPATVVRNLVLMAAAVAVAAGDGGWSIPTVLTSVDPAAGAIATGFVVLAVTVVAQGWMMLRLLRQHGRLLLRLDALERPSAGGLTPVSAPPPPEPGLPVGSKAPEFALAGLHGETMTLSALRTTGKPVLLVFSDPGCGPCTTLAPLIGRWQQEYADRLRVVVVASGTVETNRSKAAEHGLVDVVLQEGGQVGEAYRYEGTPGAVLVDVGGRIASPLVSGAPAIEALVNRIVGSVPVELGRRGHRHDDHRHEELGLPIGSEAPPFRLPTVGGGEAELAEFRGRPAVVLFWNPRCGFCDAFLPELLDWEAQRSFDDPELVVVSTGDEGANAEAGFSATVLLDATGSTMAAYGASGTPMAVLVDAEGRIATPVGVGAPGVRQLLAKQLQEVS